MFEFWHDFLYDKDTFGTVIWLLFCILVVGGFAYFMIKERE